MSFLPTIPKYLSLAVVELVRLLRWADGQGWGCVSGANPTRYMDDCAGSSTTGKSQTQQFFFRDENEWLVRD